MLDYLIINNRDGFYIRPSFSCHLRLIDTGIQFKVKVLLYNKPCANFHMEQIEANTGDMATCIFLSSESC